MSINPRELQKQMAKMQQQMAQAQEKMAEDLANMTLEGTAGGGAVTVALSGDLHVRKITIDPEAIDPEDAASLEDLIQAALTDALEKTMQAQEEAQQKVQAAALGGMRLPPGLGF
jgi:DNA-binding YbaB/EbfC family protein